MNSALKDEACKCPSIVLRGPAFGSMTFCPATDHHGRYLVGGSSAPARYTLKAVACWPVPLVNATAVRAFPAAVAGTDRLNWHSIALRLVSHELPLLAKCPTMQRAALRLANRYPAADVGQVLDPNSASGVFGFPHDGLRYAVVDVGCEAMLFQPTSFQQTLGRLGSLPLKPSAQVGMAFPQPAGMCTAECLSIAVHGDELDAEINTEILSGIAGWYVAHVNGHVEEEHAVTVDQVSLSTSAVQKGGLVSPAHPRHQRPAIQGPDGHPVGPLPRQDALIIDDGPMRPKRRLDGLIAFVNLNHLGDGPHRHLRRQAELCANGMIAEFLKLNLVRALVDEGYRRQRIAGGVEPDHRRKQRSRLRRIRQELELHGQVHPHVIYETLNVSKSATLTRGPLCLPALKDGASCGEFK